MERGRDRGEEGRRRDTESDLLYRYRVDNLYCVQSIADTDGNRPSPSSNRLKKRKGGKTLSRFPLLCHSQMIYFYRATKGKYESYLFTRSSNRYMEIAWRKK